MATPLVPMLALTGTIYVNNAYNNNFSASSFMDVKPLLYGGVATVLLELFAAVPNMEKVATAVGWAAFIGYFLGAENVIDGKIVNASPVSNLMKITGKGK